MGLKKLRAKVKEHQVKMGEKVWALGNSRTFFQKLCFLFSFFFPYVRASMRGLGGELELIS